MTKDDKTKLKGKIKNKTDIKNKVDMLEDVEGDWEVDPKTNQMRVNFGGQMKEDGMGKSGLTSADKEWIANLVVSTVKPIKEDISEIKERLDVVEQDIKNIKKTSKQSKNVLLSKKNWKKMMTN